MLNDDELSSSDQDYIESVLRSLGEKIISLKPYDFEDVQGTICKEAFKQSTLAEREQGFLVAKLKLLHKEKGFIQRDNSEKRDLIANEARCALATKKSKSLFGRIKAVLDKPILGRDYEEKVREQVEKETNLYYEKICLNRNLAILKYINKQEAALNRIYLKSSSSSKEKIESNQIDDELIAVANILNDSRKVLLELSKRKM